MLKSQHSKTVLWTIIPQLSEKALQKGLIFIAFIPLLKYIKKNIFMRTNTQKNIRKKKNSNAIDRLPFKEIQTLI